MSHFRPHHFVKRLAGLIVIAGVAGIQNLSADQNDTIVVNNGERKIFGILSRPDGSADPPLPFAISRTDLTATITTA